MIKLIIQELRPKHWLKNTIIFFPAVFADLLIFDNHLLKLGIGFLIFSFTAGSLYIINDIVDKKSDAHHPEKKHRPIASGKLPVQIATFFALVLILFSLSAAFLVNFKFGLIVIIYLALILAYSYWLKKVVIIDMVTIAVGFVLRVIAGAILIEVTASSWIIVTTFFFALFLTAVKRRLELKLLAENATNHRLVLQNYNQAFANLILAISASVALTSYSIYTLEESVVTRLDTDKLIYTVPLVFIFITRLIFLSVNDEKPKTSDPTNIILADQAILYSSISWLLLVIIIIIW